MKKFKPQEKPCGRLMRN